MLGDTCPHDLTLEPGERPIASVQLASRDAPLVVTDRRLVQAGETLVRHADVRHCYWIDPVREVAAKLKHSHFQRLIFEQKGRCELVVDGLGQAVFPLLKFYWFKLACCEPKRG